MIGLARNKPGSDWFSPVQELDHREICCRERVPCLNANYGCDLEMPRNKVGHSYGPEMINLIPALKTDVKEAPFPYPVPNQYRANISLS